MCSHAFLLSLFLCGFLVGGAQPSAAQSTTVPPSPADISVERDGSLLTIIPTYALPDTAIADTTALQYRFTVERTGGSTSRSRQGGTFTPAPGRVTPLSTSRLNVQPGDRLRLHLIVRRHDEVVAEVTRTETIPTPE